MELTSVAIYGMSAISIVFGLLACLYGFRLINIIIGGLGFICGAVFLGLAGFQLGLAGALIGAVVGGIAGMALFLVLHFAHVFLIGAMLGWLVSGLALGLALGTEQMDKVMIYTIPFAIISGILALYLRKPVIIIAMALCGASAVVASALSIFTYAAYGVETTEGITSMDLTTSKGFIVLAAWLSLGIFGIVFQFRDTAGRDYAPRKVDHRQNTVLG